MAKDYERMYNELANQIRKEHAWAMESKLKDEKFDSSETRRFFDQGMMFAYESLLSEVQFVETDEQFNK